MAYRARRHTEKLCVVLLLLWISLFVVFSLYCLVNTKNNNDICERALYTYSIVPAHILKVESNEDAREFLYEEESLLGKFAELGNSSSGKIPFGKNEQSVLRNVSGVQRKDDNRLLEAVGDNDKLNVKNRKKLAISRGNNSKISKENSLKQRYYRLAKTQINPLNSNFLTVNQNICKSAVPDILILVPTVAASFDRRQSIRHTFGNVSRDRVSALGDAKVEEIIRVVFLIGRGRDVRESKQMKLENDNYGDIILIDFEESYRNLTKKVLHGLKWVNLYCRNISYVVKADDDVFINVPILIQELKSHTIGKGAVFGHAYLQANGSVVKRNGRWAVTNKEFPLSRFPPYLSGTSYVISGNIVSKIVHTSQLMPYLPIEDAFITGIIACKIIGAKIVDLKGNSNWKDENPLACDFIRSRRISQTKMTTLLMYETWNILKSNETAC